MTILGRFEAIEAGYAGTIRTLALHADIRLEQNLGEGDRSPSHRAFCGEVECGAAWPADDESAILNVRLDDPSWPEPLRARLVRGRDDALVLVWRRPAPA